MRPAAASGRRRRLGAWLVAVASVASGVVLVSADGGAGPIGQVPAPEPRPGRVVGAAAPVRLPGGVTGLAALPSATPESGFAAGGGGLAGDTWGLFGDPADDSAVMRAVGVQVDLAAPGWGGAGEYAVFDAGTTSQLWPASGTSTDPVVPAGILRDGGAYEVAVTVGGVTTRRTFTVDASEPGAVAGAVSASAGSTPVSVNTGQEMALGIGFSSADVGVTPTTGVVGRLTEGLPPGWSWSGVGADVWKVEVTDGSSSLPGVDRIVKVYGGGGVLVLGCRASGARSVCDTADGQLVGEGPRAVVQPDGSVVLTEQSVGQSITFDPQGRVVRIAQPGTPPVSVGYTAAGGLAAVTWEVGADPLVWDVFYPGQADCDDSALPAGFATTPAGFVCGWTDPVGRRTRILYSVPAGASVPRISRILHLPECPASMVGCDPNLTRVSDFGWNERNQLVALRDSLTARTAIAGLIAPSDSSHWQTMTYDAAGRLASGQSPSPVVDDRGRLEASATPVATRVAYAPAAPGSAPATQQAAVTIAGAGSSVTTTTAVDDGGRTIETRSASGARSTQVWAPFDDLVLATSSPNSHAQTTVFDRWFRRIGTHRGPIDAFGPACSPASADRGTTDPASGDWTACAPLSGTTRATSQLIAFDEPARVGAGLTATVFAPAATGLPSPFSGNPLGRAVADQAAGDTPGIAIAAIAPAATAGSGLRLDGGLVVPADEGTEQWDVNIAVPPDLVTTGVVMVNGRFCAALDSGGGSCAVTPDARAQHLTLDLELARAPQADDRVTIALQDPLGDPPVVDNSVLVRRWSTDTTLTKIDPLPAGSIPGWSDTTVTEHTYDCGAASAPLADQVACVGSASVAVHDPGGLAITRTYTYAPDGFGGVRLASASEPDGSGATTFEHWGLDDTPAGLPHADQLGDLVTVPQRGLPKATILPGGRTTTTVHDEYGTPVCVAVDAGNWTCSELDETRRPLTHTVRADTPGVVPVTITTDYAPAGNPLINRTARSTGGRTTLTEQTELAPSGRVIGYTDALGTTTAHRYDGMGRLTTTTITPPSVPGRAPRPRPPGAAAPGFTYSTSFDPTTGLQTGVSYQGQPLVSIAYANAEEPWLPTEYTYTLGAGASVSVEVDYDSDLTPFGRTWTLADGTTLLDCATTAVAPTACTAEIGDTQPGTTASGRMLARTVDGNAHRFTYDTARRLTGATIGATEYGYAWDLDGNRTGRTVDGATTTFTFNDADQLVAASDPELAVGGFDADGNTTSVGADSYTYDALDLLASTSDTASGATVAYTRDARGRITTHRTTPGGTYFLGYSLPSDQRPTLTVDAAGVATPMLGLPGGLLFRGGGTGPLVVDMQGDTLLALTVDGRRPTRDGAPVPVQQYEPFGQPTPDSPPDPVTGTGGAPVGWQQNPTDGPLSHMGVRELHTGLGTFLQPDPRPHGSQAGPYSYTNADPVNQADPTGLCVGWGCVKEVDSYLQPIADAATLVACLLGFGVACFVTSLIRVAVSVLNFAADFPLHQDAAADGVTLAMSLLNLAAATPLFVTEVQVTRFADAVGVRTEEFTAAMRGPEMDRWDFATRVSGYDALENGVDDEDDIETALTMSQRIEARMNSFISWSTRATPLARGISTVSVLGEYGANFTSANVFGCCWKLW